MDYALAVPASGRFFPERAPLYRKRICVLQFSSLFRLYERSHINSEYKLLLLIYRFRNISTSLCKNSYKFLNIFGENLQVTQTGFLWMISNRHRYQENCHFTLTFCDPSSWESFYVGCILSKESPASKVCALCNLATRQGMSISKSVYTPFLWEKNDAVILFLKEVLTRYQFFSLTSDKCFWGQNVCFFIKFSIRTSDMRDTK